MQPVRQTITAQVPSPLDLVPLWCFEFLLSICCVFSSCLLTFVFVLVVATQQEAQQQQPVLRTPHHQQAAPQQHSACVHQGTTVQTERPARNAKPAIIVPAEQHTLRAVLIRLQRSAAQPARRAFVVRSKFAACMCVRVCVTRIPLRCLSPFY